MFEIFKRQSARRAASSRLGRGFRRRRIPRGAREKRRQLRRQLRRDIGVSVTLRLSLARGVQRRRVHLVARVVRFPQPLDDGAPGGGGVSRNFGAPPPPPLAPPPFSPATPRLRAPPVLPRLFASPTRSPPRRPRSDASSSGSQVASSYPRPCHLTSISPDSTATTRSGRRYSSEKSSRTSGF